MAAAASWGFPFSKAARRRLDHRQGIVVDPTGATDLRAARLLAAKVGVSSADLVAAALVNEALRIVARRYREQAAPAAFADALASLEQRAGREAVAPTLDRMVEAYAPEEPVPAPAAARRPSARPRGDAPPVAHRRESRLRTAARPVRPEGAGRHPVRRHRGRAGRVLRGAAGLRPGQRGSRHPAAQPRGRLPQFVERTARVHPAQVRRAARRPADRAARRPRPPARAGTARRRCAGPRRRGRADLRRGPDRGRGVQRRPGLDAPGGDDREEHPGVARPALARVRPAHRAARPGARRGAGHAGPSGVHRPLADRRVGAQRRLADHQAADGEPRGRSLGLRAGRLRGGRRAWAARRRSRTCGTGPGAGASAWRATWCPTTRASTPAGSWITPSGSSPGRTPTRPTPPTRSRGRTSPATRASGSSSRTTTGTAPTRRSSSSAWTGRRARSATSTTATTARTCPGTTRRSSTSCGPTPGRPSIRTILHVARLFPIIRFDAAMTLTRKHFQRLWFPEPGRGGDIPSRAGNGLSRADFDRAHARGVLARGRRPGGRRGARHAAAGRGVLAARGLLRAHPGHAPGLQQRVHEHAEDRGQRGLPAHAPQHARVRPRRARAVRQLHEQPRRADRGRAVRLGREVPRRRRDARHAARPADVRARAGRGLPREVRHGVHPGVLERGARPGAGGAPRAVHLPAAQAPAPVRPGRALPALRPLRARGMGERGRVRLLERERRRARRWCSTTTPRAGRRAGSGNPRRTPRRCRRGSGSPGPRWPRGSASARGTDGT